jgi:hypothetical protein
MSPTPVTKIVGTNKFIIPKIFKQESSGIFGKTDSNVRLLRKNRTLTKLPTGESFCFYNTSQLTAYPYAGHLDHPFTGTTDINFGTVDYVYYTLSAITTNNMVNKYYGQYLAQIADKDSKLITCFIKLTPADIAALSFRDTIFIDGMTPDGGHYFYLNSIEYSPTSNAPAKVELLKVKNKYVPIEMSALISPPEESSTARSSLTIGGGKSYAPSSVVVGSGSYSAAKVSTIVGEDSTIESYSENTAIFGSKSYVASNASGSTIFGSNSKIGWGSTDNTVFGNYADIGMLSNKNFIVGDNVTISSGLTAATIFASNVTATTSNTSYFESISTSSGSYMYVSTGGTNPTAGIVQLNPASSEATVTTDKVQDNTYIMLTNQGNSSGSIGALYILSRTAGASFTIKSTAGGDDSYISWVLFQPN